MTIDTQRSKRYSAARALADPDIGTIMVLGATGTVGREVVRQLIEAGVRTDRTGRFRIEGPVPASYGGPPHIHIAVFHGEYEELLSRYVVRRGATTGRIRLVLTPLL